MCFEHGAYFTKFKVAGKRIKKAQHGGSSSGRTPTGRIAQGCRSCPIQSRQSSDDFFGTGRPVGQNESRRS